jgi:hypothetical protein
MSNWVTSRYREVRGNAVWDGVKLFLKLLGEAGLLAVLYRVLNFVRNVPPDRVVTLGIFIGSLVLLSLGYLLRRTKVEASAAPEVGLNDSNVHVECARTIKRLEDQGDALTKENSELREFKEGLRGKQQQLKDVQKELEGVRSELVDLKEKDKRYTWLQNMAYQQSNEISHHVQLEKPYCYDERLTDSIPSLGFKFPVRNHSVVPVSIDENVSGRIRFNGRELADPVIIRHCGQSIPNRRLNGLAIEQRLTRTEAEHILATPLGIFDFQELEIMIKSGSDYPVRPQPLRITHEHSIPAITGQHPVSPAAS